MNRKNFIKKSFQLGVGSGACLLLGESAVSRAEDSAQNSQSDACQKKQAFVEGWITRLMNNVDARLDEQTRVKLMESCGRACYTASHGERSEKKPETGSLDKLLAELKKFAGEDGVRREGDTIYFSYGPSGRCFCPPVESGPPKLSATYCQCSVGYVTEMFERATGKPVKVELTESVKRGGKACRFTVQV